MALEAKKRIAQVVTIESVTPGKGKGGPFYDMDIWIMELRMPDFGRYPVKNMQILQTWADINLLAKGSAHDAVLEQGKQKDNNDGSRNYHFFWNVVGWDGDGISEVLPWEGGEPAEIPPTEEAKRDVVVDPDPQPYTPKKPQYGWTDNLNEQIKWGEAVKLGTMIVAAYESRVTDRTAEVVLEETDSLANMFYPLLGRGPQAPTTPVESSTVRHGGPEREPQEQSEPNDHAPREMLGHKQHWSASRNRWECDKGCPAHEAPSQPRSPSDFRPVSDALPKTEPEGNPKLDKLKLWQDKVWGPYGEKTGRSGAELKGLANSVVAWYTEDPVTKEPLFIDAVKFFESQKEGEGDLDKFLIWLLEMTANYAHMLEATQPELPAQEQA